MFNKISQLFVIFIGVVSGEIFNISNKQVFFNFQPAFRERQLKLNYLGVELDSWNLEHHGKLQVDLNNYEMPTGNYKWELQVNNLVNWQQEINIQHSKCISSIDPLYQKWCLQYNKSTSYQGFENFKTNTNRILKHAATNNAKYYSLEHNKFSDLNSKEWRKMYLGYNNDFRLLNKKNYNQGFSDVKVPFSLDWRKKNAVTPVKDQGQCGSCWAFSTIGALEGAYAIKYKELKQFSEEDLVSCDNLDGGCGGGLMDNAFSWIGRNGGVCNESSYPYTMGGTCYTNCTIDPKTNVTSHVDVNHTESSLKQAVSHQPVSVAIEADQLAFQSYTGGVITGDCGDALDHGVLLVGYGHDHELHLDYWLIKNSWGSDWGESGYVRIQRGKQVEGGQCGILLSASYPVL